MQNDFYEKVLPTINLKDVNGLIKNFIHPDNRVIILTGPEKEGLEPVAEADVLDLLTEVEQSQLEPYEDEAVRSDLLETMPTPGSITTTEANEGLDFKSFILSNGAKVTYKITDFKNDEILFGAFSNGGTSLYSDEDYIATSFANAGLSQAGIGGLSLNDMSKMMSGKIVRVSPYISTATEGFRGQAAPKDLETLFQEVYLYFTDLN